MAVMKLKRLECLLQEVGEFRQPRILLEQYPTRPHIAACMLHTIGEAYREQSNVAEPLHFWGRSGRPRCRSRLRLLLNWVSSGSRQKKGRSGSEKLE